MARFLGCLFVVVSMVSIASALNPPASDPQALTYANQSLVALTNGTSISDVTLTGNVTWTAGSESDTGSATLRASGSAESRVDLVLAGGTRTEIRDASTGNAQGQWFAPGGSSGYFAPQNCATDAVWFFPALGSLAAGTSVVLSYIGQETWNGATVQHLQSYASQSDQSSGSGAPLSTMDFYLDATTFLPTALVYNAHPDTNSLANVPVEVDFSNYQTINGVTVPMHIQRYMQGTLNADITVASATFNTGLSLSIFAIN